MPHSFFLCLATVYAESGGGGKAVGLLDEFLGKLPKEHPAYNRLRQRKFEVLGKMAKGGFRQQPRNNRKGGNKKRRR